LGALGASSVGLISASLDFGANGIVKAVSDALPFDVLGISTVASGIEGSVGEDTLMLMVMTSDDVVFSAARTQGSLNKDAQTVLTGAYLQARNALPSNPSLVLLYTPFSAESGGEKVTQIIDKLSEGVPVFGTVAVAPPSDLSKSVVYYNGEVFTDTAALVLVHGDVTAEFFINDFDYKQMIVKDATITKAQGNMLMSVNDMKVVDYFASIGFEEERITLSSAVIMYVVDKHDGTKPAYIVAYGLTPEGNIFTQAAMPEGASLSLGVLSSDDVITSAFPLFRTVADDPKTPDSGAILMYSCLTRYISLGANTFAEIESASSMFDENSYLFAYSGGEICPVKNDAGGYVNRFHNYSCVICVLK
jgi:hypothetical protein